MRRVCIIKDFHISAHCTHYLKSTSSLRVRLTYTNVVLYCISAVSDYTLPLSIGLSAVSQGRPSFSKVSSGRFFLPIIECPSKTNILTLIRKLRAPFISLSQVCYLKSLRELKHSPRLTRRPCGKKPLLFRPLPLTFFHGHLSSIFSGLYPSSTYTHHTNHVHVCIIPHANNRKQARIVPPWLFQTRLTVLKSCRISRLSSFSTGRRFPHSVLPCSLLHFVASSCAIYNTHTNNTCRALGVPAQ